MVNNHERPRRFNIFKLKIVCVILLIIPTLVLSYTIFQTHIQTAVFDTASNHRRRIHIQPKYGIDKTAVYQRSGSARNTIKGETNLGVDKPETNTAELFGAVTTRETTIDDINTPLIQAMNDTPKLQHTANTGPTAVILLTYMRSGSSLTGDILQQPEDAFYVFEPLRKAQFIALAEKPINFINGTSLTYGKYDLQRIYEETLYGWLTCDLSRIYTESLLDGFLPLGNKIRRYNICITKSRRLFGWLLKHNALHRNEHFIECLKVLHEICSKSKFRIVKTIRTSMEVASTILNGIPNSKILHLVRDPRATIESQRHLGRCEEGLTRCIAEHCADVRKDTAVKQSIISEASERVSTVLYEDIASRPIVTAQKMYSFIGMNFTETIANYVYNITIGKDRSGCRVCLLKWQVGKSHAGSETHIASWKEKFPGEYINQTQIICKDVIKNYGYEEYRAPPD